MKTWTAEEINILRRIYKESTNVQLTEAIPNKTLLAIYKKARRLGLIRSKEIEHINRSNGRPGRKEIIQNKKGYCLIYRPNHPRADSSGYVFHHIVVFEDETGVKVPDNCCVHHLNGNKSDNRIENLCLMSKSAHTTYHCRGRKHSLATRLTLSKIAKQRFSNKENHPFYKAVNASQLIAEHNKGRTVKEICEELGISKSTYYSKIKEENQK